MSGDPTYFTIRIDSRDPLRLVIRLVGEFDLTASDELRAALLDGVNTDRPAAIIVDLDAVHFIDTEAVGAILDGYIAATRAGIDLRICDSRGVMHRILELLGLLNLLTGPTQ